MTPPYSEQAAIVTGANRGLGLAISRALAQLGMHVVLTGRDPALIETAASELAASGLPITWAVLDVTDPESI